MTVKKLNDYNSKWITGWKGLPELWYKLTVPSVTKVINELIPDPEMEEWVRKVGEAKAQEIMTNAGYRGTAMHLFIENFVNQYAKTKDASKALKFTQETSPSELIKEKIPQYKIDEGRELFYKFYYSDFSNNYNNLIGSEIGIYSPSLYFRGLADVFYNDRVFGPAVTDYKTSNGYIKKGSVKELKYKTQLGGYAMALDEMYKTKNLLIKRASILCINTKTEILQEVVCEGTELEKYKQDFKTLVLEWHKTNNQEYLIKN